MQTLALSPELCGKIVDFLSNRHRDLLSLSLTCKTFQREAEIRLYSCLNLTHPETTLSACDSLLSNERLALHVRIFVYNEIMDNDSPRPGTQFWSQIQRVLIQMVNLETLILSDLSYSNSWIFGTPNIQFRLREVRLRFAWDAYVMQFFESQTNLRSIHFHDSLDREDVIPQISPQALPNLQLFDGSMIIGFQLLSFSPLTHLQLIVDCEHEAVLEILSHFATLRKTLRGLSLLDIPEEITHRALDIISRGIPEIRHLGLFPYPVNARHEFHEVLMRMHSLQSIELDVGRWNPPPYAKPSQRVLISELCLFCPSLKVVMLWMGHTRARWAWVNNQWHSFIDPRQLPQHSNVWCSV
ncbi:hypothetical protein M413DRAFT_288418 [Hebeloma cylindrosporum]|uniref:F-box domain-containing protein n=1 Tax=Hebeloma cylindrosporum TaxID=76867 RepID=A0A0C3BWT1_HEBCY|nr:hypothetical protein M413DRAFT_288418 [Hebeloma cylindrosporum h7]